VWTRVPPVLVESRRRPWPPSAILPPSTCCRSDRLEAHGDLLATPDRLEGLCLSTLRPWGSGLQASAPR
jgi:hypothetical protein